MTAPRVSAPSRRTVPLPRDWERTRARVLARWGRVCHWCGEGNADQVDHVVPASRGGGEEENNLRPIHGTPCHAEKTAKEARGEPRARKAEQHPGDVR